MARVAFISHASEDAAIAATITEYLENNGVSCWVAPRDVTPGREYSAEIVDGIESSAVFVLVLSEHANASIYVKREVERAVSKGKPIFPIRVREVMPSRSLELFIAATHWIDAWTPPLEKYLERLAQSIASAAAVYPAETPVAAPMAAKSRRPASQDKRRRFVFSALTAAGLLAVGAVAWYVHALLGPADSARSAVELSPGSGADMPAADQIAPAAGPVSATPTATRQVTAPAPDAAEPCPSKLSISPDLPTPFTCLCSGEAARNKNGSVWGTDAYTDRSDLCRAALHAGAIGTDGGTVTVVRSEGRAIYAGSARNGVTSDDYGSYDATIAFEGTAAPEAGPEPCPSKLSISPDLPTPFTCLCSGEAARNKNGSVWGTDAYTDRSDLCRAALHAGAIGTDGGTVTVVRSEGRAIYAGSARNGVTSDDYGSFEQSIRFQ